jgi:DNA primase
MARDSVAEVRERTDIVEVVGQYVQLKRAGRSFKGVCPFHQEKTPSFIVFPESQNFHCFGCGKGGDVFTFYQSIEHVEFREALQELARRAGVQLSTIPTVAPEVDAHRTRLLELNELVTTFFHNVLVNTAAGEPGRGVVKERGLNDEMVERFALGYAIEGWDNLLRYLTSRGVDPALAAEAGLLQARDGGGYYDRFRGRLIFPIRDRDGRVVGFGGRVVGEGQPKYLNSPQSAIFDKSTLLYALDVGKDEIRRQDQAVIVEGYMDAIAAHQFGHANVVATMGTALTESQVGLVKRLTKHLVLALDADAAGQMATLRGLDTLREALDQEEVPVPDARGMIRFERKLNAEIAIVRLPEGKDPDELIRRAPERWPEVVAGARPFLEFLVDAVVTGVGPTDARAKSTALAQLAPVLASVSDPVVVSHYVNRLAAKLATPETLVRAELRRNAIASARPAGVPTTTIRTAPAPRLNAEDYLLALLLKHRSLCPDVLALILPDELGDARNRELLTLLQDPQLSDVEAEQIVIGLDDPLADHAERLLGLLANRPSGALGQVQRDARQALDQLRRDRFDSLKRQLEAAIRSAEDAGDAETVDEMRRQIASLFERHQAFDPPPSPYFLDLRSARVQR